MKAWNRNLDDTAVHKVGYRTVVTKVFTTNAGQEMHADVIDDEGHEAVITIPITTNGEIVIAEQFRCGPERVLQELPGGNVDPGEEPAMAAVRELREETGYEPGRLEYVGKSYVNAWSNTVHHFYLAHDCHKVTDELQMDQFEEVSVRLISPAQLIENAKNAHMTDAIAVLFVYDRLKALENNT